MKTKINIVLVLFLGVIVCYSQEKTNDCKVLIHAISQNYKGACLNNLAEGKGEAKGKDKYIGFFHEGLPEGKGKYTFGNGNVFEGNFKMGKKEGEGKFIFSIAGKKMVQKGFWQNDEYVGVTNPKETFILTSNSNLSSYNFKKNDDGVNKLRITLYSSGIKFVPRYYEFNTSSGSKSPNLKEVEISDFNLPFHCEILYTLKQGGNICNFSFDITKPGNYELEIFNN